MDLYHIPGDTGGDWRLNKFIEYAIGAPTVCHPTIISYSNKAKWGNDMFLTAAFLHALFYEELTAIASVDEFGTDLKKLLYWFSLHKPHTNPDKKRVVTMNQYPQAIHSWLEITEGDPTEWIKQFTNRKDLRSGITKVKYIGGFSADLFENCLYGYGYDFGKRFPDWGSTPQLAEGMLLLLYKDEEAIEVHSGKSVNKELYDYLDKKFEILCKKFNKKYPNNPPEVWYTKLCSFTNLFHGTRYGGFHHDRQLGNLYWHMENEPEFKKVWHRIFWVRRQLWEHHMLGELHDWNGIRSERKKLWLTEGLTGVEE